MPGRYKTTKEDFKEFKRIFLEYIDKFGVWHYTCYFEHTYLDSDHANIRFNLTYAIATVRLSTYITPEVTIHRLAKHEALHVLIAPLDGMAHSRCVSETELTWASEEVVGRLERLIQDEV